MFSRIDISKETWKEISNILKKHKIPYVTHCEPRDIPRAMEYPDLVVQDKHIQINLVVPDYFEEESR